jgi:hypothetical protein
VAGNVYGSLVIGDRDIYPSPADALWLSFYVLIYVAIVHFVKARIVRLLPSASSAYELSNSGQKRAAGGRGR